MYPDEERLDSLFAAYREALPDPETGPAFMPGLWSRIDARRRSAKLLRRLTGAFVTTAVALSLIMAFQIARAPANLAETTTYVDTLDEEDIYHTVAQADASRFVIRPTVAPGGFED
ncbi:MAG: hypothetical protein KIT09_04465 [Bryobacteraceae bacterium]|nr:hypothetical protein [Bryobacteraceae bacterium]